MALLPWPNSQTPPEIAGALGQTATPDALSNLISSFFNDARSRVQSQDLSSVFTDMLNTVQNQPAPTPLPVPPSLNPVGQLASVFASTLADQLGARGTAAAHEDRVNQLEQAQQRAKQTNILRADEFAQRKATQELDIRMKINDAKAEQAKQLGDLNEYEARLKTSAALQRERQKMTADARDRQIKLMDKDIFDRMIATEKLRGANHMAAIKYTKALDVALKGEKGSDAVKAWAVAQRQLIFAKDISGEYIYDDAQREQKVHELYNEYLQKVAEENNPDTNTNDGFDSLFQ